MLGNPVSDKEIVLSQLLSDFRKEEDVCLDDDFYTESGEYEIILTLKGNNKSIELDMEKFVDWIVSNFEEQSKRENELVETIKTFTKSVEELLSE